MNYQDPQFSHIKLQDDSTFNITSYTRFNRSDWTIKKHFHNIYEIVLYKEINGSVNLNCSQEEINSTKLLYVPPYAIHGFTLPPQECLYTVIHISNSLNLTLPKNPMLINIDNETRSSFENLLKWAGNISNSEEFKESCLKVILTWINQQKPLTETEITSKAKNFRTLLKYLNDNNLYNLSTTEASNICGMSRSSFLTHFKKSFNVPFHKFLLDRRVDEAKYLLHNSNLNCLEIALKLGFSDSSHFTKVFKKTTGKLPKEFLN